MSLSKEKVSDLGNHELQPRKLGRSYRLCLIPKKFRNELFFFFFIDNDESRTDPTQYHHLEMHPAKKNNEKKKKWYFIPKEKKKKKSKRKEIPRFLPIPKTCPNLLYEPMWLLYQDSVVRMND